MFHLRVILQVVDLAVDLRLVEDSQVEVDEAEEEEVVGNRDDGDPFIYRHVERSETSSKKNLCPADISP